MFALALACAAGRQAGAQTSVTTFHYDNGRTGWNSTETALTPATVGGSVGAPSSFGLLSSVALDAQVNAQPLVVPGVVVTGDPNPGTHDVVYVVTEGNTVYAIDSTQGTVLLSVNLGTPVPPAPYCGSPQPGVGIMSTPVIDLGRSLIYLIAYTQGTAGPTYTLHALSLSTLADAMPPQVIAGSQTLTNGKTYAFNAAKTRQRPALLEANNAIYAGFGAFCDGYPSLARGWVMGWTADTLLPLNQNGAGAAIGELTNRLSAAPNSWFLESVWMSGAGLAADTLGVYFLTGNADKSGTTYDGVNSIQNSLIKLSASTSTVLDLFTPYNVAYLDQHDDDFASGGVMLLPPVGSAPPLATAAGKFGTMYLLNRTSLGGYTPGGPDNVLASETIGRCWCIESYFAAPTPTVVSSGGYTLMTWQVNTTPSVGLTKLATAVQTKSVEDAGFFTSVSSNGATQPIIWAVIRPGSADETTLTLSAFGAAPTKGTKVLPLLFSASAGTWPGPNSNADVVPVVANGRVYVASYQQLAIFGLGAAAP